MVPAISCRKEAMRQATMQGFATATDLADYLVRKGIAFRDAHEIVGKAVAFGVAQGRDLSQMELSELQGFCERIEADVFDILTLEGSLAARNHIGGTAPDQVRSAIARAKTRLER
jgi:argininosuccinate lyase